MCAITFVEEESSSPVCYISKKERDAGSVQFDREGRECEGSREVEEWGEMKLREGRVQRETSE